MLNLLPQPLNSVDTWDVVVVGQEGACKSMDGRNVREKSVEASHAVLSCWLIMSLRP